VSRGSKFGSLRYGDQPAAVFYDAHFAERHIQQYELDVRMQARRVAIAYALSTLTDNSRVLDVGCGVGDVVRMLSSCGHRYTGLDVSIHSLTIARRANPSCDFLKASVDRLPFLDATFDALVSIEVLEHLPDDRAAAIEMARVLKPDGLLVISVPNQYYFPSYRQLMGHFRHYDRQSLLAVAAQAGLIPETPLAQNRALNIGHLYLYSTLRLLALAVSRISRQPVPAYSLTLPGQSVAAYEQLRRSLFSRLADKAPSNDGGVRQTFFAFRKPQVHL
jgi:ubiquinone/menaquinone biosynthesis C-methylase UbiE